MTRIHPTAEVAPSATIGDETSIWNQAQVREGARIGSRCVISKNAYIDTNVTIGNGVKIQNNVSVYYPAVIEDDVFIGPAVTFTNDPHPRAFIWDETRRSTKPITLKKGSSIGANATLLCGVTIGEYAMVAAGSVVTRDVPPHGLVLGVPARLRGFVCKCGGTLNEPHAADENMVMTCTLCKKPTTIPRAAHQALP